MAVRWRWSTVTFPNRRLKQPTLFAIHVYHLSMHEDRLAMKRHSQKSVLDRVRRCIQKFPDWGARTANGAALRHYVQLYSNFVSQSNEFCRHNPLCCFLTSVFVISLWLSPETFGYTLVCANQRCQKLLLSRHVTNWIWNKVKGYKPAPLLLCKAGFT
jgi:hypothetical protein